MASGAPGKHRTWQSIQPDKMKSCCIKYCYTNFIIDIDPTFKQRNFWILVIHCGVTFSPLYHVGMPDSITTDTAHQPRSLLYSSRHIIQVGYWSLCRNVLDIKVRSHSVTMLAVSGQMTYGKPLNLNAIAFITVDRQRQPMMMASSETISFHWLAAVGNHSNAFYFSPITALHSVYATNL